MHTRSQWIFMLASVAYFLSGPLSMTPLEIKDKLETHGRSYTTAQIQQTITTIENLQQEEKLAMEELDPDPRTNYTVTVRQDDYPHKEQDLKAGDLFQFSHTPNAWYVCIKDGSCTGAAGIYGTTYTVRANYPSSRNNLAIAKEVEIIISSLL